VSVEVVISTFEHLYDLKTELDVAFDTNLYNGKYCLCRRRKERWKDLVVVVVRVGVKCPLAMYVLHASSCRVI
jgi:hypothetical protein